MKGRYNRTVFFGRVGVNPAASRTTSRSTRSGRSRASITPRVPPKELPTTIAFGSWRASKRAVTARRYAETLRSFSGKGPLRLWSGRSGAIQGRRGPNAAARGSHTSAHVGYPWRKKIGEIDPAPEAGLALIRYRKRTPPASRNRSSIPGGSGPTGLDFTRMPVRAKAGCTPPRIGGNPLRGLL